MPTACIARRARRGCSRASATRLRPSRDRASGRFEPGDVIVLMAAGRWARAWKRPIRSPRRLKYLEWGREVAVITDARFSGVSTGACIGHVGPEALAGGPIGKVLDGDRIRIIVDRNPLEGTIDLVGDAGARVHAGRRPARAWPSDARAKICTPTTSCPTTRGCGPRLQRASGGTWAGCVYDVERIVRLLEAGERALEQSPKRRNAARRPTAVTPSRRHRRRRPSRPPLRCRVGGAAGVAFVEGADALSRRRRGTSNRGGRRGLPAPRRTCR